MLVAECRMENAICQINHYVYIINSPLFGQHLFTGHCGNVDMWRAQLVRVLDSGSSGLGLSPGSGHCIVFLGRSVY